MMIGKVFSFILFGISLLLFWFAWWVLNPIVQASIPAGEWHNLLGIIATILIAYFGGIGLPFMFICFGVYAWIVSS